MTLPNDFPKLEAGPYDRALYRFQLARAASALAQDSCSFAEDFCRRAFFEVLTLDQLPFEEMAEASDACRKIIKNSQSLFSIFLAGEKAAEDVEHLDRAVDLELYEAQKDLIFEMAGLFVDRQGRLVGPQKVYEDIANHFGEDSYETGLFEKLFLEIEKVLPSEDDFDEEDMDDDPFDDLDLLDEDEDFSYSYDALESDDER